MPKECVLVVDDLPDVRATLSGLLSDEGYEVYAASSMEEALHMVETHHVGVAVLDVRLDESDEENREGITLMHNIKERSPATSIIILTGYADVKMVRDALQPNQAGIPPAFGFLEKTEIEQLPQYVARAFNVVPADKTLAELLIAQGENERVEFKSSLRWDFKKREVNKGLQQIIAKTIAGMLNASGGHLVIGVDDAGKVVGIEQDLKTLGKLSSDGFRLILTDLIKTYLGLEYAHYISPSFETLEGKTVCIVEVKESPGPVFFTKGTIHELWVRMGSSTRQLDAKEIMQYSKEKWGQVE